MWIYMYVCGQARLAQFFPSESKSLDPKNKMERSARYT